MSKLTSNCKQCGTACVWSRTNVHPLCITCRMHDVEEDLAAFKASHQPMRSGEPAEVLAPDQQDARSWALINAWLDAGYVRVARCSGSADMYLVSLWSNGYSIYDSRDSRTRSDALAHVAEWCKGQL